MPSIHLTSGEAGPSHAPCHRKLRVEVFPERRPWAAHNYLAQPITFQAVTPLLRETASAWLKHHIFISSSERYIQGWSGWQRHHLHFWPSGWLLIVTVKLWNCIKFLICFVVFLVYWGFFVLFLFLFFLAWSSLSVFLKINPFLKVA